MKYVLVNKSTDEIIDRVDLGSNVGVSGATTYFKGTKKLPNDEDYHRRRACDMERQSNNTLFMCVFDLSTEEKKGCYHAARLLDEEYQSLATKYFNRYGEYPLCPENLSFKEAWDKKVSSQK